MKILIDENIPYGIDLFSTFGKVELFSGRLITNISLKTTDALIVRSTTKVNEKLLRNSSIKFVGTVTAGIDHIDQNFLKKAGIFFSSAPGCNAIAVVEYVFSVLLLIAEYNEFDLRDKTVGIIGVGNIGSNLYKRLKILGVNALLCDPPLANLLDNHKTFLSLEKIINEVDILSLHTTLNYSPEYSTFHLINERILNLLPNGIILLNTSRGSVIDNQALFKIIQNGKLINIILDVWENEPVISLPLLKQTKICTPHIAGYSIESQLRGIIHIFNTFNKFLGQQKQINLVDILPLATFSEITLNETINLEHFKRLVHFIYNVHHDDFIFRKLAYLPGKFDELRKNYSARREWSSLTINSINNTTVNFLKTIGFNAFLKKKYV